MPHTFMVSGPFLTKESKLLAPPHERNPRQKEAGGGSILEGLRVYTEAPSPPAYDKDPTHHGLLF